jgi:hypothetical protein
MDRKRMKRRTRNDIDPRFRWLVDYSYRVFDSQWVEARTAEEAEEMIRNKCCGDDFKIEHIEAAPGKKRA